MNSMNSLDFSSMVPFLGPGTGGLWMGEQQKLATDAERLSQEKTLEDIATSKQNRDIASQKLPLELEKMRNENETNPLKREELRTQNQERQQTIDRKNYEDFLDDLGRFQPTGTPADQAVIQDFARKYKLPPDHPMVQAAEHARQNPEMFKRLQDAVAHGSMKSREKAAEKEADFKKSEMERKSAEKIAQGNNAASIKVAEINAERNITVAKLRAQATEKLASWEQESVRLLRIANDPKEDPKIRQEANRRANEIYKAKFALQTAVNSQNIEQMSAILNGGGYKASSPPESAFTTTTKETPATQEKRSPQDQEALDWANANPNDPRAAAIKQKLGVK